MKPRHLILGVALVISAALVLSDRLSSKPVATVIAAVERSSTQTNEFGQATGRMSGSKPLLLALEDRQALLGSERAASQALFAVRSWAPPPVEASSDSEANTAPPLPFGYAGKVMERGQWTVFLTRADEILAVREGDKIDSIYWVKSVQPPKMEFTYSPLEQSQEMNIE